MKVDRTPSEQEYGKDVFTDDERVLLERLRHQGLRPNFRERR